MKILVINGSPKGEDSITYQTARYLHMKFADDKYSVIHAAANIDQLVKNFEAASAAVKDADLIVFCYPVYAMMVPSQMMHFIEILKSECSSLKGKYVTQITTSDHFFDMTAHRYIEENCNDLGLKVLPGISLKNGDLLTKKGQLDVIKFWNYIRHCVVEDEYCEEKDISEQKKDKKKESYIPSIPRAPKDSQYKVLIITDCAKENQHLRSMIIDFRHALKYESDVENLHYKHFKAGCCGCLKCAVNSKCIYKDGFELMMHSKLAMADAVVFAFEIKDHSTGYIFQMYEDRQFCSPLNDIVRDKPTAYIISGDFADEDNLKEVIEARAGVTHNFIAGYASDEENTGYSIQKTADKLSYALYHRMSLPGNYYSVTGEKMMHDVQISMQNAILMRPVENMRTLIKFWKEAVTPYERLMKERNIADTKEFALQLPNVSLPDLVIPEISLKKIKHKADKKNN